MYNSYRIRCNFNLFFRGEKMSGDLHCHTIKSDGSMRPVDLVGLAARLSIPDIAVTDHDTMAGVKEAAEYGKTVGVNVIPGIEISTYDYKHNRKLHMLCYYPKKTDGINEICAKILKDRSDAGLKMLEKVATRYPINLEILKQYSEGSCAYYKQHIVLALMDMGYSLSVFADLYRELFSSKNGWAYVGFKMIDSRDALKVVKESGGAAVLAHPGVYGNFDVIEELASLGLDGVEVNHPRMTKEDCQKAYEAAEKLGLIRTGGSDFHGMNASQITPLGTAQIEDSQLKLLKERFS